MQKAILMGIVILCSMIGAVGQLFFKLGTEPFSVFRLFIGLSLYGIATVIYIFALRFGQLSSLYGLIALSYIWVMFLSMKFLGETVSVSKWVGAFGVVASVILISR